MKYLSPTEKEKLKASFSQRIAGAKVVAGMNYEQYLIACLLTAHGPIVTNDDIKNASQSAANIINAMAESQVAHEVLNG